MAAERRRALWCGHSSVTLCPGTYRTVHDHPCGGPILALAFGCNRKSVLLHFVTGVLKGPWLFLNRRGHLFIAENVVRQALTPILDRLKIPRCGFHAFRHLHASLLLSTGAAPQVAQKQLRHADPRMTLGVYAHVIGDLHREAVDKVATRILFPNVPNLRLAPQVIQ